MFMHLTPTRSFSHGHDLEGTGPHFDGVGMGQEIYVLDPNVQGIQQLYAFSPCGHQIDRELVTQLVGYGKLIGQLVGYGVLGMTA